MASIDRYRPPREGYQPPSLPAGTRQDRASKSPTRRRDVPPAVPTPPQHPSTRTSPPSQARNAASPSRGGSGNRSSSAKPLSQWSFSSEEVHSTPSIVDGLPPSEERLRRAKGVNFIYQAGVMLDLPQITLWVAGVFFHRFFMRRSMVQEKGGIHHYNIAASALFLANKTEENCRKTKDIIIAVAKVAQKNAKLVIDEQSKEYWRWRDSILTCEEVMLEQLTFDLMIDNPYRHLFETLGQLDIVHNKSLRQAAWAFCNDACLTALPLLSEAKDVAIAAIFFATVHTNTQIDDVDGEAWWRYLKGDEHRCARAIEVIRQFYTENPLKKQTPSLPSPAYHLDNTRRLGDPQARQNGQATSTAGTPMDVDRSPAARVNGGGGGGGTDWDVDMKEGGSQESSSQARNGRDDYMPRSPSKRREAETEPTNGDHDRAEKRARISEDEEGEVVED